MTTRAATGSARAAKPKASRPPKPRSVATPKLEVRERATVYRGATREAAVAAYHADARVLVRMGFAPASEDWSMSVEQVLTVHYVHAPEKASAVLAAIAQAQIDPIDATIQSEEIQSNPLRRAAGVFEALSPEVKIALGGVGGIVAGIVLCFVVGWTSGDDPDAIGLFGFALIGMVLGAMVGLPRD
jgi:F0F1-type ATP synthase assembly protein I